MPSIEWIISIIKLITVSLCIRQRNLGTHRTHVWHIFRSYHKHKLNAGKWYAIHGSCGPYLVTPPSICLAKLFISLATPNPMSGGSFGGVKKAMAWQGLSVFRENLCCLERLKFHGEVSKNDWIPSLKKIRSWWKKSLKPTLCFQVLYIPHGGGLGILSKKTVGGLEMCPHNWNPSKATLGCFRCPKKPRFPWMASGRLSLDSMRMTSGCLKPSLVLSFSPERFFEP